MSAPGRKVQREILRSKADFQNHVLVDFFTTMSKIQMFQAAFFFFVVGNALFFHVQYPVIFVTR